MILYIIKINKITSTLKYIDKNKKAHIYDIESQIFAGKMSILSKNSIKNGNIKKIYFFINLLENVYKYKRDNTVSVYRSINP